MSRTYRAKSGDRSWADIGYYEGDGRWKWRKDTAIKYWESDNSWRPGRSGRQVKVHCDTLRRADERLCRHKAMKDEEFDFIDKEKAYKSIWWIYD